MFPRISNLSIVCITLIVVCGIQQVAAAEVEAGTWTRKADMPTKRTGAEGAVVDGKIYVFGGWMNTDPYTATRAIEVYDPATDTWTEKTDMPTERLASVCAVNGIIYAIGGYIPNAGFSSAVEAYDPATEKWTKKASMPTARTDGACAAVDGKIYVFGGYNAALRMLSTVEVYDPSTDKWSRKADMPTGKSSSICVIDGKIYLFGGNPTWEWGGLIPTVEVYDPATDTWSQVSDMPWTRSGSASLVNGKVYIIGGVSTDMIELFNAGKVGEDELVEQFSIVDVYDPATDTWTTVASIPTPRSGHDAGVVDGKIYIIGGTGPQSTLLSEVYEFDPGLPGVLSSVSPAGKLLEMWGHVKKVQ
jgi:N-acetylneuraminic acid mutarotase